MSRPKPSRRMRCAEPDCPKFTNCEFQNVLGIQQRKIVFLSQPSEVGFWGSSGFLAGPGFLVWAKDFPVGTRIRVTAEVILPEGEPTCVS